MRTDFKLKFPDFVLKLKLFFCKKENEKSLAFEKKITLFVKNRKEIRKKELRQVIWRSSQKLFNVVAFLFDAQEESILHFL